MDVELTNNLQLRRALMNTTEFETQDETQDQRLDLDLPLVTDDDSAVVAGGTWMSDNILMSGY